MAGVWIELQRWGKRKVWHELRKRAMFELWEQLGGVFVPVGQPDGAYPCGGALCVVFSAFGSA